MKKVLSLTLALFLLLSTFPVYAMAAETDTFDHDELIAMACEVFPEYASTIRGENLANQVQPYSLTAPTLILEETRQYSNSKSITYAEFSDGTASVASHEFYPTQVIIGTESDSSSGTIYRSIIKATSNFNDECFMDSNVKYLIVANGLDRILSYGDFSDSTTHDTEIIGQRPYEEERAPAYVTYRTYFTVSDTESKHICITFKIQSSYCSLTYSDPRPQT
ncbi:MAG: hypothetical protein IKA16_02120 [Oscillospiraceae bacterium]|nr:hypothetical protein [Oscillospiraceae bacterium]